MDPIACGELNRVFFDSESSTITLFLLAPNVRLMIPFKIIRVDGFCIKHEFNTAVPDIARIDRALRITRRIGNRDGQDLVLRIGFIIG